ncbi:disulfide bond formation protein B [Phaeobacter italicus]|uniref:disulfide bond formation protein B n=1 Tax=Phaeobacter italicus TaxID=481446 RepID=UPI0001870577|nr:disulfide bond formation protein B [Phaeobacter italicus]EEB71918.1 disulphide bond formation protein DsbB [Ruegeria sp. R11]CRL14352.1 disulfide bond formation protein B [Phaeobacter italicus]SFG26521.1 Disulfide bond formation protein DsbB [Phaeobacter italicus]
MSRLLIILASAGSAALLLGAFGFQYIGEMAPCKLCIWQRYPHGAAVVIGAVALAFPLLILPYLGALAALATAGVGAYHTGVERGWWEGPSTCTSGPIGNLSADELMQQIMSAPLVRCDDVPWEMLGLSMASWNAIASFVLALLWIAAANHMRKA